MARIIGLLAALVALSSCTSGQPVDTKASGGGATFEVLGTHRSIRAGTLYAEISVQTTNAITIDEGIYLATSGEQRQATMRGPTELGANSDTTLGVVIPGVETGGTLTIEGCAGPDCYPPYTARVKVGS